MNNVTVHLKNGHIINFDTNSKDIGIMGMCTNHNTLKAKDGNSYHFNVDDISAVIIKPYIVCRECNKEVLPTVEIIYANDMEYDRLTICPKCKAILD